MDFRTAGTTPEALRRELTRRAVARIAVEAYAQAGWVHDLCADLDLGAIVASSAGATWRWKREKRKTAREDALKLASLVSIAEFDPVAVPRRAVRQWESLIGGASGSSRSGSATRTGSGVCW